MTAPILLPFNHLRTAAEHREALKEDDYEQFKTCVADYLLSSAGTNPDGTEITSVTIPTIRNRRDSVTRVAEELVSKGYQVDEQSSAIIVSWMDV